MPSPFYLPFDYSHHYPDHPDCILDAFGHEVGIQALDIALSSTVYFARDYHLPRNLLGRTGWLNKLRFGLIEYDRLIYLSRYDG